MNKKFTQKILKKIKNNISESEIINEIKDYLQYLENQEKLMFIRNNSGATVVKSNTGSRYITYGKKGSTDIFLFLGDTIFGEIHYLRTLALEVKKAKGTQSKVQKEWQENFEKLGGEYYIVRSVEDVKKIIDAKRS